MRYFNLLISYGRPLILAVLFSFYHYSVAIAQEDDIGKEVMVVRSFEPTIADAPKINLQPTLTDTIRVTPVFSYNILPVPHNIDFDLEPVSAARMPDEEPATLYSSYIKLGLGSYLTPTGELSLTSLRNERLSGGIWLKHHSSQGRLTLDDDRKAFSQFSDNNMEFYGKRMGEGNVMSARAGIQSNGFHYYGYDTDFDSVPVKDDIKQRYMLANARFGIKSAHTDSSNFNYDINLNYNFFQDRLDVGEHGFRLRSGFNKYVRGQIIGADIDVDYYSHTFQDTSNIIFKLSPWFTKADDEWEIFAGFHAYYDLFGDQSKLYFHPKASLQFSLIQDYVIPYVGIDGRLNVNNYHTITKDNPFIIPELMVDNSNRSMDFYGGLKGNFTRDIAFNLSISYAVVDGMHFFINDSLSLIGNMFSVVYDDVEVINYSGEIAADISDRFNLLTRVNYHKYSTRKIEKPWHRPSLEMQLHASYKLFDRYKLTADIFYSGERYAQTFGDSPGYNTLPGITDFNIGVEYRHSPVITGFLRANNLTNARYYKWNNYPVQGISLMAGFTYSL